MEFKIKNLPEWYEFFKDHTIEADVSYRGGTFKASISELLPDVPSEQAVVGAYQNYLGGGIAGAIQAGAMMDPSELEEQDEALMREAMEAAKRYFYNLNNGGGDEWMQEHVTGAAAGGYEENQKLSASAY